MGFENWNGEMYGSFVGCRYFEKIGCLNEKNIRECSFHVSFLKKVQF